MKMIILVFVAVALLNFAAGKTFTRCELAKELLRQGFSKTSLPDWVCLVEAESSRRTEIIGPTNKNGSKDYGLFQINSNLWCKIGSAGNKCGVSCENVIKNDIAMASACAKKIFTAQGYGAWVGWKNKCRGKPLPNLVKECKI